MRSGIDRPALEVLAMSAVQRILSLPAEKVFIAEFSSDTAAPTRPFVSLLVLPANSESMRGTVRYQPGVESWRFQVLSNLDALYSIIIDGVSFGYSSTGETVTQIRDGLLAMLGGANYTAVAAGTACIDITSTVLMRRLLPSAVTPNVSLLQLRGNVIKITSRTMEVTLQARCMGYYSDDPDASNSGVDMAEKLMLGLLDTDTTSEMRRNGFAVNRVIANDMSVITDGFQELVGTVDAIVTTESAYVTTVDNTTGATVDFTGGY